MKKPPLSQTNIYLRDPEQRKKALLRSVISSSAIEGIKLTEEELEDLLKKATAPS